MSKTSESVSDLLGACVPGQCAGVAPLPSKVLPCPLVLLRWQVSCILHSSQDSVCCGIW